MGVTATQLRKSVEVQPTLGDKVASHDLPTLGRTRRLSAKRIRGRLIEHLDRPCPYCGIAMNDFNGRNDWRAGRVKPISAFKALRASETTSLSRGGPE